MFEFSLQLLPFIFSACLMAGLIGLLWRWRNRVAGFYMLMVGIAVEVWTVFFIFELAATNLDLKIVLANIEFLGIDSLPVYWLGLTLAYTGHYRRWRYFVQGLLLVPVLNQIIIWTTHLHHLFRNKPYLDTTTASFSILANDYSYWYYCVQVPFVMLIFLSTTVLLVRALRYASGLLRTQILYILVSTILPLLINFLYVLGLSPIANVNLTTVAFTFSGSLVVWSLLRYRFLDFMPVARSAIMDTLPDAWLVLDQAGRVVDLNHVALDIIGSTKQKVLGQPATTLLAEKTELLKCLEQATTNSEQDISWQQAGQAVHYALQINILKPDRGEASGKLLLLRDITQRKEAAAELERAKELAEVANRTKSTFLAVMSHEIRTPMNGILGMTNLLLDTPLNSEQEEYAQTILTSGEALLNILNDILDFSKIEADKVELEMQPLELREVLENCLDLVSTRTAAKNLELTSLVEESCPAFIQSDATRLRQILLNLLTNAVKFTEQGEISVVVSGEKLAAGDDYELRFAIRDTGIGIAPEDRERLFQSFSQVDASTTRKYGGTGLGLAISRRLAELMGGRIWVESQVGSGSTFYFTIRAEAVTTIATLSGQIDLRDKRLLIVDDNATNRRILAIQAERWGMLPTECESGIAALELVEKEQIKFDLAILDMQMPQMDGMQLAETIHSLALYQNLPLVMLTSLGQRQGIDSKQFVAILNKPAKVGLLHNAFAACFNFSQATTLQRAIPAATGNPANLHQNLKILVAEDNLLNQKIAQRMLERLGYSITIANNGFEVLAALDSAAYDLVFMDMQMPEIDGLQTTRIIRQKWPGVTKPRIVAMTANVLPGDRELCLQAGMDDFLTKPIRLNELHAALQRTVAWLAAQSKLPETATAEEIDFGKLESLNLEMLAELQLLNEVGEADILLEVSEIFQQQMPNFLKELQSAATATNLDKVSYFAHAIKGSAGNLGATRLIALTERLEKVSETSLPHSEIASLVEQVEKEYTLVSSLLAAMVTQSSTN